LQNSPHYNRNGPRSVFPLGGGEKKYLPKLINVSEAVSVNTNPAGLTELNQRARRKTNLIISIYSPKGGVGNTLLTLALARKASEKLKTCALEFDFTPGDFPAILDIDRRKNIYTAMRSGIEQAVQKPAGEMFDAIVSGYPDTPERFEENDVSDLVAGLASLYELVLVDIQPAFIPAVMDVMNMSDKILLITTDNFSVVSRTVGTLDWAISNNFIDISNIVQLVNMQSKKNTECVNLAGPQIPVIYTVPYMKNISGYKDKRLQKHCANILNRLMPDIFEEPKRRIFAGKAGGK
jgi:MinD-like ATPase involved in chromosome partitioning or flagellar assembly